MPRLRVIILNSTLEDPNTFQTVFWADVPTARQLHFADPNKKSAWPDATAADNQALQNGSVMEQTGTLRYQQGTGMAAIQAAMQQQWTDFQARVSNTNPWQRYGTTWDGNAWVVANNA